MLRTSWSVSTQTFYREGWFRLLFIQMETHNESSIQIKLWYMIIFKIKLGITLFWRMKWKITHFRITQILNLLLILFLQMRLSTYLISKITCILTLWLKQQRTKLQKIHSIITSIMVCFTNGGIGETTSIMVD